MADGKKPAKKASGRTSKKAAGKTGKQAGAKPTKAAAKPEAAEAEANVPGFVKDASPADRKAAVEQLAADAGIAPMLAKAPWRRSAETAAEGKAAAKPTRKAAPPKATTKRTAPAKVGVSGTRPVILDSNALMMQFQFHIDIEQELKRLLDFKHEIVVPSIVVDELSTVAKEAVGKDAGEARMALAFAKTFKVMDAPGEGDTGILRLAEKLNAVVVTNDKILRARLRAKDIPNIYMRSSAFLTIEGHVTGT